jgi:hypothetical protein
MIDHDSDGEDFCNLANPAVRVRLLLSDLGESKQKSAGQHAVRPTTEPV